MTEEVIKRFQRICLSLSGRICHAMVQSSNELRPLSVEALRSINDDAKKRAGATG